MFAIIHLKGESGADSFYRVPDNAPVKPLFWARQWALDHGVVIDESDDGQVPDDCGDLRVTIARDLAARWVWDADEFFVKREG